MWLQHYMRQNRRLFNAKTQLFVMWYEDRPEVGYSVATSSTPGGPYTTVRTDVRMPGKGRIAVGHDADFTLVDLGARRVIDNADIASKVGWTVWHGREVAGWPMATVIRGRLAMRDGEALGGPQDLVEARRWYSLAAAQGHVESQFNLGAVLWNGQGVARDVEEAIKYFKLAAESGEAGAQYGLGVALWSGQGLEQNVPEALRLLRLAAEQGHVLRGAVPVPGGRDALQ